MATFCERAAYSVYRMFSLYCDMILLVISHFNFEGRTLVLIASVPGHCLSFTFYSFILCCFCFLKLSSVGYCHLWGTETNWQTCIQEHLD